MGQENSYTAAPDHCLACLCPPLLQSYDTELLLPRDSVCVPVQPVVVVKRESEPTAISFMGALRIPVSYTYTHRLTQIHPPKHLLLLTALELFI